MPVKLLFRSHIYALNKILEMLRYHRSMSGNTQIILCKENKDKVDRAINLIEAGVNLLKEVF